MAKVNLDEVRKFHIIRGEVAEMGVDGLVLGSTARVATFLDVWDLGLSVSERVYNRRPEKAMIYYYDE